MDFNEDDQIRRLIQISGSRPNVPDDLYFRVKSRVHSKWKRKVQFRIWTDRFVIASATFLITISVYLFSLHLLDREYPLAIGIVENISGDVFITPEKGQPHLLTKGEMLMKGSRLESGESGRLLVRLLTGASIRMDFKTLMNFKSESEFFVQNGGVYLDTHRKKVKLALSTQLATITNEGTQFEVRVEEGIVHVRVREGSVLLERNGIPRTARAGTLLAIDKRGKTTQSNSPGYGPHWSWISSIAPGYRLEGHTLQEFLHWVSRENGWVTEFSDPEIKRNASKIVLHGSLSGLSSQEMLSAVLPTCNLKFRIEGGVLKISKEEPQ